MSDQQPRILILEGYDEHPYSHGEAKRMTRFHAENRLWCAKKNGRRLVVERWEPVDADDQCSGEVIRARTKKLARQEARGLFRKAKSAGRIASLSGTPPRSRGMNTAQRRFAAAAKACRVQVGTGGKNRSYLSCMQKKLKR